jgi:hypothetical protein
MVFAQREQSSGSVQNGIGVCVFRLNPAANVQLLSVEDLLKAGRREPCGIVHCAGHGAEAILRVMSRSQGLDQVECQRIQIFHD